MEMQRLPPMVLLQVESDGLEPADDVVCVWCLLWQVGFDLTAYTCRV
jgi:hypothetical protein